VAFGVIIVKGLFAPPVVILSGWLADRFGRKPVMLVPAFALLVSILPAFWIVAHHPTTMVFYAAMLWLIVLAAFNLTPVIVTVTESMPRRVRSGAVSIIYAFAISIFGGSTQFVVAWLIDATKNPLAPAWYWTGAMIVGLTAMVLVKESAPPASRRAA
jgi:MFS family permease